VWEIALFAAVARADARVGLMSITVDTTLAPAPDTTLTAAPAAEHAAWTVEALRTVWEHQQGRVDERIETIERAVRALASDRLGAQLRRDAERAAHMLAGSLGMFGFVRASRAARNLELELACSTSEYAPVMSALLTSVRSGVRGPVGLPMAGPY
jgi:HPt (histidine-containing phosphotransfer) domain-containing protein